MSINNENKRVIVLGFDGLDPKLTEKWMDAGLLPSFSKLREKGTFNPLTTTNPPETAAAWAAFSTGQNPGKTGVFDFVIRDPKTYTPIPGLLTLEKDPKGGPPRPKVSRKGTPIWKIVGDKGFHSTILNLPVTWPPDKFNGRLLSGMGVPDISGRGTRAGYYRTGIDNPEKRHSYWDVVLENKDGIMDSILYGPGDQTIPIRFEIDEVKQAASVLIDEKATRLEKGHLSDWCTVSFPSSEDEVFGMCRFCLLELDPEIKIYCSPIQIHPEKPLYPISNPSSYATELYEELGPYRTQGREVDIFNLQENIVDDEVLLEDTFLALEERERLTVHLIDENKDDLIVSWFGVIDTTQHGFWRFIDPQHPLYSTEGEEKFGDAIQRVYQWLDGMVGRMMENLDDDTLLIIASDHGCTHWRRSVDFNARLLDEGFLVLLSEEEASQVEHQSLPQIGDSVGVPFSWVDWEKTRAYSIGCGKVYLNLRGREGKGFVNPGSEAQALEDEIIQSFQSWVDPDNGKPVVSKVYRSREVQWGPLMNRAPELIVGLHGGYRVAFSSIRQISTRGPLKDNNKKISGDHISVDYELVPGTILSNMRLRKESGYPHLLDIAPTILEFLGVEIPEDMDGSSLWR